MQLLAAGHVPQPCRPVLAAGEQGLTIGTEGHMLHGFHADPIAELLQGDRVLPFGKIDLVDAVLGRRSCVVHQNIDSTKLLRGDTTGISRLHGREEVLTIGVRAVRLYPLYHPAAALYTPSTLEALRADFHRIPELLALGPPPQPEPVHPIEPMPEIEIEEPELVQAANGSAAELRADQLGLF